MVISETKSGNSFLNRQFRIPGFAPPFRRNPEFFSEDMIVLIAYDGIRKYKTSWKSNVTRKDLDLWA